MCISVWPTSVDFQFVAIFPSRQYCQRLWRLWSRRIIMPYHGSSSLVIAFHIFARSFQNFSELSEFFDPIMRLPFHEGSQVSHWIHLLVLSGVWISYWNRWPYEMNGDVCLSNFFFTWFGIRLLNEADQRRLCRGYLTSPHKGSLLSPISGRGNFGLWCQWQI